MYFSTSLDLINCSIVEQVAILAATASIIAPSATKDFARSSIRVPSSCLGYFVVGTIIAIVTSSTIVAFIDAG